MSKKFVWWLLLLLSVQDIGAQPKGTLRLVFAGDVLLDRGVRQRIRAVGVDCLFAPSIDSLFHSADIVVANLECPATKIKAPVNKRFIFRAEPSVRKTTFIGTCVESPKRLRAYAPVGTILALSRLAMALAISSMLGETFPITLSMTGRT